MAAGLTAPELRELSGRWHQVMGGIAVRERGEERTDVAVTRVRFRDLSDADIERYLASGEWTDRAGGYAIQELGAMLVEEIGECLQVAVVREDDPGVHHDRLDDHAGDLARARLECVPDGLEVVEGHDRGQPGDGVGQTAVVGDPDVDLRRLKFDATAFSRVRAD